MQELQALQNAADDLNLTIYEKQVWDKRVRVKRYFAQMGKETVSPTIGYEGLNLFLLGWRIGLKKNGLLTNQ